ncbi:MAG: hypothetical protein AABZ12_04585 [Planctomycetota bacterium]
MWCRGKGLLGESVSYQSRDHEGALSLPPIRTIAAIVVFTSWTTGCARPAGELFPPITPLRVWPAPPDVARIRYVGALAGSQDLQAGESPSEVLRSAFQGRRPPIRFSSPQGLAVSSPDLLAVADGVGGAVHVLDLVQRTHTVVFGDGDHRFDTPMGVAWVGRRLFVTDAQLGEIVELDEQGRGRGRFGKELLQRPVGIAYEPRGDRLYVADSAGHVVRLFTPDGELAGTIGQRGTRIGEFNFPTHLCTGPDRIAVADSGNARVQLFRASGEFISAIGEKGDAAGDLSLPKGVAFDRDGHLYVADARFENVQVFDGSGRLLMAFGEEGRRIGQFSLPAGLVVDGGNYLWAADSGNRRVQVFEVLHAEGTMTAPMAGKMVE